MTIKSNQVLRLVLIWLCVMPVALLCVLYWQMGPLLALINAQAHVVWSPFLPELWGIWLSLFLFMMLMAIPAWVYWRWQHQQQLRALALAAQLSSLPSIDEQILDAEHVELFQRITPIIAQQQQQIHDLDERNELFASALDEINDMGKQLRVSERRWALALAATGDGIWEWDASKNAWYFSSRWKSMLGYDEDDLPNTLATWRKLMHADDLARVSMLFTQFIQVRLDGLHGVFEAEFRMRHRNGNWQQILSRAVADRDHKGRVLRVVGAHSDVSEQRRSTAELSSAKEAAELAVENLRKAQLKMIESEKLAALGALVAGVAHEVNTPLGIALTAASTLDGDTRALARAIDDGQLKKTELQHYLSVAQDASGLILRHCNNAASLIRSFKNISVDQASEMVREFDLGVYLQEILLSLRPSMKQTAHQIELDCPEHLIVRTYPGAFTQIISNLVNNAILHAFLPGQQGLMKIQILPQGSQFIELHFMDNGIGVPPSARAKVFEPFYTTKRGQGGSGLGMSIVHNLVVAQLQGAISIEETPGGGASFVIVFPRVL